MSRAERVTAQCAQQLPNRSVVWYSVGNGFDTHKAVASLAVGAELATQIHLGLFRVLLLIQPVLVRLPDIEQSIRNRCPISRKHAPRHNDWLTPAIFADGCPHCQLRRTLAVERAEDRALSCIVWQAVIVSIYHHHNLTDVVDIDKLRALIVAHVTHPVKKLDTQSPLF